MDDLDAFVTERSFHAGWQAEDQVRAELTQQIAMNPGKKLRSINVSVTTRVTTEWDPT